MSLILAWTDGERARLAVDTSAGRPGALPRSASKVIPMAHAGWALAGRGNLDFMRGVFDLAHTRLATFDEVLESAAEMMADSHRWMQQMADDQGGFFHPAQELCMVGWSPKQSCMVLRVLTISDDMQLSSNGGGFYVAPWEESAMGSLDVDSLQHDASLIQVALRQLQMMSSGWPDGHFYGGNLIVLDITRAAGGALTMTVRDLGPLRIDADQRGNDWPKSP